jgi:hypothetical protein
MTIEEDKAKEELERMKWETRKAAFEAIFVIIKDAAAVVGILLTLVNAGFIIVPNLTGNNAPTPAVSVSEVSIPSLDRSSMSGGGSGTVAPLSVPTESVRTMLHSHVRRGAVTVFNILGWVLAAFLLVPWIWDKIRKKEGQ